MSDPRTQCPARKLSPPDERGGPAVERSTGPDGSRWVFRSFELVRAVLREESAFAQAGFGAANFTDRSMRRPILYLEGPAHRSQRRAAARLFAPKITEGYRTMMEELAGRLVGRLRVDRATDLSDLSLRMAVEVAARVVGLTNSSLRGMTRRLNTFFEVGPTTNGRSPRAMLHTVRSRTATLRFHWLDVRPAIRARRRHPGRSDDVIAQLIDSGFSDLEILTECLTYGAAGMVTTREFITVAAWHLLDDPALLARFRAGDVDQRTALLNETLRLEPVVGHLLRRAEQSATLAGPDGPIEIAAGDLVDLDVRAANADAATAGAEPLRLCPGRELPRGVPATMMSFGDGHHRCPGAPIAIMETEIFLSALFAREVRAVGPPRVRWNPVSMGYDLDDFALRLAGDRGVTRTPRLASDLARIWLSTGIGFVVSLASSFAYAFLAVSQDLPVDQLTGVVASMLGLVIPLFTVHQILTWRVFAPREPQALRDLVRRTNPRTKAQRWFNLLSGNGPKSWSLAASGAALVIVVLVIVDPDLRSSPVAIGASVITVALGWTMIVFANATSYLRDNSESLDQLAFPDRDADDPPVWRDYFYLAVQVSTTFSTSDVTVRTTRMRGRVTAHSIVAFVFNTVIIALVVSAIVINAG